MTKWERFLIVGFLWASAFEIYIGLKVNKLEATVESIARAAEFTRSREAAQDLPPFDPKIDVPYCRGMACGAYSDTHTPIGADGWLALGTTDCEITPEIKKDLYGWVCINGVAFKIAGADKGRFILPSKQSR